MTQEWSHAPKDYKVPEPVKVPAASWKGFTSEQVEADMRELLKLTDRKDHE